MLDDAAGVVEISSRVLLGLLLMRPSKEVNDIILGILGRAQRLYGVRLHSFIFMSNHFHILATVDDPKQMARFCRFLKSNIARELGDIYDWKEKYWGRRYHSASLALTEEDQLNRVSYIFDNGCKEGLVASPLDWPGVTSAHALCRGESTLTGTWYDRSAQYRASLRGKHQLFPVKETVHLTPLPFLEEWTAEQQRNFYTELVRDIEQKTALMHKENGTKPLGAEAILRQNPHSKPENFKASPAPPFHAVNPEDFKAMLESRKAREAEYSEAARRLRLGETDVRFPEGCFPPALPFVKARPPT